MNIADWLYARALQDGSAPALFQGNEAPQTYEQFALRAQQVAQALRLGHCLQPGDRVALYMKNSTDYLVCMFGVLWAGATIVPVNYKLHPKELGWILQDAGATLVIADADIAVHGDSTGVCTPVPLARLMAEAESMDDAAGLSKPVTCHPDDLAWLFYTSGTTGRPKGVMLSHQNLVAMSLCYPLDVDNMVPGEAVLYAAPMSHGAGLYAFIHVRNGSRHVVTPSQGFDAAEIFNAAAAFQNVSFFAAPTMVKRLVAHAQAHRLGGDGLKTIVCGGAPMYAADLIEAMDVLGPKFALIYGQGESPMTITALHRRAVSDRGHPDWQRRIASVGVPHSCVAVQVVNDAMQELPAGEHGEVLVRGTTVMAGYWRNDAATSKTLVDGWLRTGDIGFINDAGFLTLTDRSKDVIISGGTNIYPREVEEVLVQHPAVFEAAVVGEPHSDWGEQVVAFVLAREDAGATQGELDDWCRQHMAAFKRPKRYVFVSELPKSSYGKILKTALRERL